MSKPKHLYGIFCWTMSRKMKEIERSLVNRLNASKRHLGEIKKAIFAQLEELDKEQALDSNSIFEIFKYLLDYNRIDKWNPIDDDGNPIMDADRLLDDTGDVTAEEYLKNDDISHHDLDDVQKLRVNDMTNGGKLGISIYRLAVISFMVATEFLNDQGIVSLKDKEKKKLWNGEHDKTLLKCAERYHNGNKTKTSKKKAQDKDESDEADKVPTLEMYENGEISPADVEDNETLEQWYEQLESAGKKGAVRKVLNKRKQKAKQEN